MALSIMIGRAAAVVPTAQRAALVDLYTVTNGTGWLASTNLNWLSGDPCSPSVWANVGCLGTSTVTYVVTVTVVVGGAVTLHIAKPELKLSSLPPPPHTHTHTGPLFPTQF